MTVKATLDVSLIPPAQALRATGVTEESCEASDDLLNQLVASKEGSRRRGR